MIPIIINIGNLANEIALTPTEVKSFGKMTLDRVVSRYEFLLNEQIDKKLHKTKQAYRQSLSFEYLNDFNAVFILSGKDGLGKLALMMERGATPFDMKQSFLVSSKAKTGKDGKRYFTVPFKHATSTAIAESSTFSNKMVQQAQLIAKKQPGVPVSFKQLPSELQERGIRKSVSRGGITSPTYEHKTPIFQGLVKSVNTQHSGYFTFRRVSEKNADSWFHPGFEEYNLMGKALSGLESEIGRIVSSAKEEFLDLKFGE